MVLRIYKSGNSAAQRSKWEILSDQIIDSLIVAGISGLTNYINAGPDASLKGAGLGFLLVFLIKLKEYRGVKA